MIRLQSLDRISFYFRKYGSDGGLSPSPLSQTLRKVLKLFRQVFSIGLSDYALYAVNYILVLLKKENSY